MNPISEFFKWLEKGEAKRRRKLWYWVEFRNGCRNSDTAGFYCLSSAVVKELLMV